MLPLGTHCTMIHIVKELNWSQEKNRELIQERDISFEVVARYIEAGDILDICVHPNKEKYPGQKLFIIQIKEYVYVVPFVETDTEIFLKTIFPSRKATKEYVEGSHEQ